MRANLRYKILLFSFALFLLPLKAFKVDKFTAPPSQSVF
jgi:hypothetical protein